MDSSNHSGYRAGTRARGDARAARDLPSDVPGRPAPERVRSHASARRRREEKILKKLASASDRRVFGECSASDLEIHGGARGGPLSRSYGRKVIETH